MKMKKCGFLLVALALVMALFTGCNSGQGEAVVKYGEHIGIATAPIPQGGHVHVHNVVSPQEDRQAKE